MRIRKNWSRRSRKAKRISKWSRRNCCSKTVRSTMRKKSKEGGCWRKRKSRKRYRCRRERN